MRWPEIKAPPKYKDAHPDWEDPALPDFPLIWKTARRYGYAVGLHGSMVRDCDLIAVPWTDDAVTADELVRALCEALNATIIGEIVRKPHGRRAWNLQIDGYFKVIDLSVTPLKLEETPTT